MDRTDKELYKEKGGTSPEAFDLGKIELETINPDRGIVLSSDVHSDFIKLRDNILELNLKKRIRTIAVTSSMHGEGSSTVAFNLALALSRDRSSNVLLMDGNLRGPSLHGLWGVHKEGGLAETVLGRSTINGSLKKSSAQNLFLMTSGNTGTEPDRLLMSTRFRDLMMAAGQHFDFVIIDSPPINQYPDSTILSTMVDGILLVIQAERVIYEVIQKAREKIEANGGNIIGTVLNRRRYYIPDRIYRKL